MTPERPLLFIHLFGVVLWVGSFITYPFWGAAAQRHGGDAVPFTYRILARVNLLVTMPGYWLAIIGGTGLVVVKYGLNNQPIWLVFMEVVGYLLFFMFIGMLDPRQRRLARLAANTQQAAAFRSLNRQQALIASIAGSVMILVIAAATFKPGT